MTFNQDNFISLCDHLAQHDPDLIQIIQDFGYPLRWYREPSFESLIHFILEQQVSLASALAALKKLREKIGDITPENLLELSDEQLKECYFSRQKIIYARCLAAAVKNKELIIDELILETDEIVGTKLKLIKGIGQWTTDVFLMMSLSRTDVFPIGDIALINSIRQVKNLPPSVDKQSIATLAEKWKPYRTIAAFLLWHSYLEKRKKRKSTITSGKNYNTVS